MKRIITSTRAALDLASIMVGIIVIGIIGGIIGATVFAVIPWAQDNAAKASLDSVKTAESAYSGFTSRFGTSTDITSQKLLQTSSDIRIATNADGSCYVAISKSATGKIFYNTNTASSPELYVAGATNPCANLDDLVASLNPVTAIPDIAAVSSTQTVTYGIKAGDNRNQLNLSGVTITTTSDAKEDWKIKVYAGSKAGTPFNQLTSLIRVNHAGVTGVKEGDYFVFTNKSTATSGVDAIHPLTFDAEFAFTIADVPVTATAVAAPTGNQYTGTQSFTVTTPSKIYGTWKTRVDLSALKAFAFSSKSVVLNNAQYKLTKDTGNIYWVETINATSTAVVRDTNSATFTVTTSTNPES